MVNFFSANKTITGFNEKWSLSGAILFMSTILDLKKPRNDNDINVFKLMVFILIGKMKEFENV